MKKWFVGCSAFLLALLTVPVFANAQVKYLKVTVVSAKLWPTKPSGRCWDPCLGKRFQLPARGAKKYQDYFKNKAFNQACSATGTWAPDALVEVKIGKYSVFTTDKKNNTCMPTFNVSKVMRITPGDSFSVSVYDNDGAAGFQAKRDLMGAFTSAKIPAGLLNGGKLVLKSFGQVEELVLKTEVVKAAPLACPGNFRIRVASLSVAKTKEGGKTWDKGIGRIKNPDIEGTIKIGGNTLKIAKQQDKFSATFKSLYTTLAINKSTTLNVNIWDRDRTWTMKLRPETIGQYSNANICSLIKGDGVVKLSFGRVKSLVLIFDKK